MPVLQDTSNWIRQRTVPLLALSPFILLAAICLTELYSITNLTSFETPIEGQVFAQVVSGGSLILSYALIVLYWSQTRIQKEQTGIQSNQEAIMKEQTAIQSNQEAIMEQNYVPHISGEITSLHIVSTYFRIRNTGDGPAFDVNAKWKFGGQTRNWEIPALIPGEDFGFPLLERDEGGWLLNTSEIETHLDSENDSGQLKYCIECTDMFDRKHEFSNSVDFDVMSKRAEAQEMWDQDPIEEINNEIGKIRRETRKISQYTKKKRDEMTPQTRRRNLDTIREIFNRQDQLSFKNLQSLSGLRQHDLQRSLERLDEVGELTYNSTTNTIIAASSAGSNQTLDDYNRQSGE